MASYLCFVFYGMVNSKQVEKRQFHKCEHHRLLGEYVEMLQPPVSRVLSVTAKETESSQATVADMTMPIDALATNFNCKYIYVKLTDVVEITDENNNPEPQPPSAFTFLMNVNKTYDKLPDKK